MVLMIIYIFMSMSMFQSECQLFNQALWTEVTFLTMYTCILCNYVIQALKWDSLVCKVIIVLIHDDGCTFLTH